MDPVLIAHDGFDEEPPRRNLIAIWKGGYGGPDHIAVNGRVNIDGQKDEVLAFLRRVVDMVERS